MDIAVVCYRCGNLIFKYQILYGSHDCRKCGSRRVTKTGFTGFGTWYCNLRNKIGLWYYEVFKAK